MLFICLGTINWNSFGIRVLLASSARANVTSSPPALSLSRSQFAPGVVKVRGNSGAVTSPSRRRAGFSMGGIVKMVIFSDREIRAN